MTLADAHCGVAETVRQSTENNKLATKRAQYADSERGMTEMDKIKVKTEILRAKKERLCVE